MNDYTRPTYLTPGSIRFSQNCSYSCSCKLSSRIAAFGAIRRAAEIARELDAAKIEYRNADDWMDAVCCEWRAYSVRMAIRAAIGSPKA